MKRIFKYLKGRKGITLVWMAFMLAVLLMLAGLAIDIAYMYYVKNQLQVAADAAALAGAAELTGGTDVTQTPAREEAWRFACRNNAAGSNVFLVASGAADCNTPPGNLNSGNDPNGDIVVGNWDPSRPQSPVDLRFLPVPGNPLPTGAIINAVKVVPRRTFDDPVENVTIGDNPVRVFIGQIFRFIGADWSFMSARASAIASRPPRAIASVAICHRTCTEFSPADFPLTLYWAPYPSEVDPGNQGIAWTVFSETSPSTPTEELVEFFCGKEKDACNLIVYSSNGYNNSVARQFRCAFKNPLYESDRKTCADGSCDSALDNVTSWNIIVPVFDVPGCPPGDQPYPYEIISYAELNVIEVYASGGGGTNRCACGAYDAPAMSGSTPNAIVISGINCIECPAEELMGRRPILVQ